MKNHYTITLVFTEEKSDKQVETHQTFEVKDDDMLKELKGDEAAQVRVALEVSDKSFGRGVSVTGSITLTVGQDDMLIETAFNYGSAVLTEKIKEITPKLNAIYEEVKAR